jgi:Cell division protein CrgA
MAYESKRFTPKKSDTGAALTNGPKPGAAGEAGPTQSSGRYTPRATPGAQAGKSQSPESPAWVAWLMFAFFGIGLLIIVINYTNIWWAANNWALLGGLAAIIMGFITATRLR